jgi:hypothetical protein
MNQNQLLRSVVIAFLTALFFLAPEGHSPWIIWLCLAVFYSVGIPALRGVEVVPGLRTPLAARPLFYAYIYLLLFYPYQLYVLGLYDLQANRFLDVSFVEKSNASLLLSTVGVLAFDLGYSIRFRHVSVDSKSHAYGLVPWLLVGGLAAVVAIYWRSGLSSALVGAYVGSTTGDVTTDGIYFLCTAFSMWTSGAFVFQLARRSKVSPVLWVGMAIVAVWSMALLVMGDRNNFFLIVLVLVGGYATFVKRVPLLILIAGVFCAFFVYNVVEVARKTEDRSFQAIRQVASNGQDVPRGLEEGSFGITTITSRAALSVVEEETGYFYGKFKLIGFAGIVPYSRSLFVAQTDRFEASSRVLTYWMVGPYGTWGVGSNVISDAYLDFGAPGVIVFLFLLGLLGKYVEVKASANPTSMKWVTAYLLTVATFAEMARYTVDFPVRCIVWGLLIFYLGASLFGLKVGRSR